MHRALEMIKNHKQWNIDWPSIFCKPRGSLCCFADQVLTGGSGWNAPKKCSTSTWATASHNVHTGTTGCNVQSTKWMRSLEEFSEPRTRISSFLLSFCHFLSFSPGLRRHNERKQTGEKYTKYDGIPFDEHKQNLNKDDFLILVVLMLAHLDLDIQKTARTGCLNQLLGRFRRGN